MNLRRFLERLTRPLIYSRRLPRAFGRAIIYVSPAAGLRFLFKPIAAIDAPLLSAARRLVKPGDVVWDIGANVGLFSLAAAVCSGRHGAVMSFEPDSWLASLLRRTSSAQPVEHALITVVPAAVASQVSLRQFSVAARSRASNALAEYGSSQMGGVREQFIVATFNLDWLLTQFRPPNIIKIDVEGAELEVLRDQQRILQQIRPVIICEVGSQAADEISVIFKEASYCMFDGDEFAKIDRATWNTIAIPSEKQFLFKKPNA